MILKYLKYILFSVGMIHVGYSQSIYKKDSLTILADSLDQSDHNAALLIRKQAQKKFKNSPEEYLKYLDAKYIYTKSCVYENRSYDYANNDPNLALTKEESKKYLDSALNLAYKARKVYKNVKKPDKHFLYDIQNRIYHQTAYLGNWHHALEEAELGYTILKDTLGEKDRVFINLIYNIGHINTEIGDYSKAVQYYQRALNLYKDILGENNVDMAQSYTKIAVEYQNLGLRKKELESLLKAESIWENLNSDEHRATLYDCYGSLFYWYSYYGDFVKAEEYLAKKEKLKEKKNIGLIGIARNEEEAYKEQLNEWSGLMLHYLRKKDTVNATNNIKKIIDKVNPNVDLLNFETKIYSLALKYYSDILRDSDSDGALNFLSKAINIQVKYRLVQPTHPIFYQLEKAELLVDLQRIKEADSHISQLMKDVNSYTPIELFRLYILKGKISDLLNNQTSAQKYFDQALSVFNETEETQMESLAFEDLKPIISFESIDGFVEMGDFYFNLFKEYGDKNTLNQAFLRYTLASKIFNNLYLGERYNNTLFNSYTTINQRLLLCANENQNNNEWLLNTINEIENNGSKLSWSKFIFNNERKRVKLPERLINREKELKAELNFYKNKLFDTKENSSDKKKVWKEKVYELESAYLSVQDTIKQNYNSYYQFNFQNFDIKFLQQKLDSDSAVIKYILTNDYVFSIVISKNNVKLIELGNKKTIETSLKKVKNIINNRTLNYQNELNNLQHLLLAQIPMELYDNITIVPDGPLFYLPFEMLLISENMPLLSYSPSLLLLMEQKKEFIINDNIQIGAFAASSSYKTNISTANKLNSSKLANVDFEINNILDIFEGNAFINSSKETFLNQANNYDILHFSMHSSLNDEEPEFSSLDFYGDEKINRLFISELYNETFKANMVVLSSCDTGSGIYKNGEGVISLSRAFTYAGVPSTIMSLWKVPDKESAVLMKLFYQYLKKGQRKDKALFQAKLDYLNSTDDTTLKHPYYWAGFVVSGDISAISSSTNYLVWILAGLFLVFPTWFIIKKSINLFK